MSTEDGIFRDAIPDNSLLEKGYIRRKLDSMLERVYTESELIELLDSYASCKIRNRFKTY